MEAAFLKVLNISITSGWLILAVLVLRVFLKKAPKSIRCVLWGLAAFRLACPFSFQSALSLIPSTETVPQEFFSPAVHSGAPAPVQAVPPAVSAAVPAAHSSVFSPQTALRIAAIVWIAGMAVLLLYALASYIRLRKKTAEAVPLRENLWLCDRIPSPFILGIFCPRIYLPSAMAEQDIPYAAAHEKAHLARRDHWWKPLGFVLLAVYWFHPLVWAAYLLLCRDIELACDERVIKTFSAAERKAYSETLLSCSISRRAVAACPLAFGENSVKGRIKAVLNYRKPGFWVVAIACAACIAVAVCFLTDPGEASEPPGEPSVGTDPVQEWVDYYGSTLSWNESQELTLPEFPGVIFQWTPGAVSAREDGGVTELFSGMPVWNVYLTDLTGDGLPEFCATVSYGSGMIDDRVVVYDYAAQKRWELSDRGYYDFVLSMDADTLVVTQYEYNNRVIDAAAGSLALVQQATGEYALDMTHRIPSDITRVPLPAASDAADENADPLDAAITAAILEHFYEARSEDSDVCCESHIILDMENTGEDLLTIYAMVLYLELDIADGSIQEVRGSHCPTALTFRGHEDGSYVLTEYWEPKDADGYASSIREKFPADIAGDAMDTQKYITAQMQTCYAQAASEAGSIIEQLFETIMSSPAEASDPGAYLDAHDWEYRQLIYLGNYTLDYIFSEFLQGNQTGLKGHMMRIVLDGLAPESQLKLYTETGQEYFDEWFIAAQNTAAKHDPEWMEENMPAAWRLLQMA